MILLLTRIALAVMRGELPTPDPPPNDVKQKAKDILRDGQFHGGSSKSVMQRIIDWFLDKIKLPFSKAAGGNGVVGFVILIVFLVALSYVISRIRFRLPAAAGPDKATLEVDVEEDRPADTWRSDAEQAEAAGQWKLALRARYRWLLGELFERQLLSNVPGRTPGEYRTDVERILPQQARAFAAATDLFERAWYGDEPTGAAENGQFRSHAEAVIAAATGALV